MKFITAIIRETQLDKVRETLIESGITRITVSRCSGHGQQKREEIYRGSKVIPNLIPKVKVEIAVNAKFESITIDAILKGARTHIGDDLSSIGQIGDGKIFITNLEECIRIRTGEKGNYAI